MKKTRSNHFAVERAAIRKPSGTLTQSDTSVKKEFPARPSEEIVAKLNAIAREYPFCVMYKPNNISLL